MVLWPVVPLLQAWKRLSVLDPKGISPSGANPPANLAALTGITATPATAWAVGQWVNTADLLAAHWTGSAWVLGKA